MSTKLTPLEWHIYRLLEERTLGNNSTVSQREIYQWCVLGGFPVTWNNSQNQHNDHCRWLYDAIKHLRESHEIDHIPDHDGKYNYRLLNEQEAAYKVFKLNQKEMAAKRDKVALLEKMKRNGQGKLLSNQDKPIVAGSKANEFVEAFNYVKHELETEEINGTRE